MAQLCPHADDLERLNVKTLLVTFSSAGYAEAFKDEVCAAFPVLINRERDLYATYGLESSFLRSWGVENLWSYVKKLLAGVEWKGIQGNSTQLGGDFIINADGVVQYAYRSKDPTDRPSVEELLTVLRGMGRAQ